MALEGKEIKLEEQIVKLEKELNFLKNKITIIEKVEDEEIKNFKELFEKEFAYIKTKLDILEAENKGTSFTRLEDAIHNANALKNEIIALKGELESIIGQIGKLPEVSQNLEIKYSTLKIQTRETLEELKKELENTKASSESLVEEIKKIKSELPNLLEIKKTIDELKLKLNTLDEKIVQLAKNRLVSPEIATEIVGKIFEMRYKNFDVKLEQFERDLQKLRFSKGRQ
jgi:chromosome segregation ATPase